MIYKYIWTSNARAKRHDYNYCRKEGWFLFGLIPLYIREINTI